MPMIRPPLRSLLTPLEDYSLNFHPWEMKLSRDPDRDFILNGLQNGFTLPGSVTSHIDSYITHYYSSATCPEFKPDMDELFLLSLGRMSRVANKPQNIHPIGCVPKSCLIPDYSRPRAVPH